MVFKSHFCEEKIFVVASNQLNWEDGSIRIMFVFAGILDHSTSLKVKPVKKSGSPVTIGLGGSHGARVRTNTGLDTTCVVRRFCFSISGSFVLVTASFTLTTASTTILYRSPGYRSSIVASFASATVLL